MPVRDVLCSEILQRLREGEVTVDIIPLLDQLTEAIEKQPAVQEDDFSVCAG